jgi:hypothetical protein
MVREFDEAKPPPNLALPRSIFVKNNNRGSAVLLHKGAPNGGGGERTERSVSLKVSVNAVWYSMPERVLVQQER